jgi:hypothetical protein
MTRFLELLIYKIPLNKLNPTISFDVSLDRRFFFKLFFFFSLLPYVSPLPLGSDVQITAGLVAYFILFIFFLKDKVKLTPRELFILSLCFLFLFYINFDESTYQFRKAIGPLYGFGILYLAKRYNAELNRSIIFWVIGIYFVAAITQLLSPTIFSLTFENFIRVSKYSSTTGRGLTSLCTEPSFFGIICVYLIILLDWSHRNIKKDRSYYVAVITCILMVVLSKSGTGYILCFLLFAYKSRVIIKRYWYVGVFVIVAGIVTLSQTKGAVSGNKGLSDLIEILKVTEPSKLLYVSSFSNRINPIIVGVMGFVDSPLGKGSGAFTIEGKEVYNKYKLYEIYPAFQRDRLLYEISIDSVSTFGKYIFEYGLFFILYLLALLFGLNYKAINPFILFLLLTSFLFGLPIVYPPMWLLFGLFDKGVR